MIAHPDQLKKPERGQHLLLVPPDMVKHAMFCARAVAEILVGANRCVKCGARTQLKHERGFWACAYHQHEARDCGITGDVVEFQRHKL